MRTNDPNPHGQGFDKRLHKANQHLSIAVTKTKWVGGTKVHTWYWVDKTAYLSGKYQIGKARLHKTTDLP
jgi:hypothetical protein